ncbi:MAG TPA: hypothetical protein GX499_07845 [Clostridiales bacterium]|nr:hypothetical protein [Clostridiales bacterium]
MDRALITMSNGEVIELTCDDRLNPVGKVINEKGEKYASLFPAVQIWSHVYNGVIPSIADVVCNYPFFYINDDFSTLYSSSAIVKIELK